MRKTIIYIGGAVLIALIFWLIQRRIDVADAKVNDAVSSLKLIQQQNQQQLVAMQQQVTSIQQDRSRLEAENSSLRQKISARQQVVVQQQQQLQQRLDSLPTKSLGDVASRAFLN